MFSLIVVSALLMASPGIGFGVGQTLGHDLLMPSLFTVRIGVGESFLIAPEVNVSYSTLEADIDSTKDSDFVFGVESNLYRAFWKKERTAFYGIFGAGFEISRGTSDWYEYIAPDSVQRVQQTTNSHTYGLNLGLGAEQLLTENLAVSINSLSSITLEGEKRERERNGDKETLYDRSGYSFDFQNLQCNIYLIWYF